MSPYFLDSTHTQRKRDDTRQRIAGVCLRIIPATLPNFISTTMGKGSEEMWHHYHHSHSCDFLELTCTETIYRSGCHCCFLKPFLYCWLHQCEDMASSVETFRNTHTRDSFKSCCQTLLMITTGSHTKIMQDNTKGSAFKNCYLKYIILHFIAGNLNNIFFIKIFSWTL